MGVSNNRIKEGDTVHHLVSRIAHRVFFLKDEECREFIGMMRRSAEFVGVKLLGWCIMTNHFHILAYLPMPVFVEEPEVIRRVGVLKGEKAAESFADELARLRAKGPDGEKAAESFADELARLRAKGPDGAKDAEAMLEAQRARMGSVGSFMKILKQWFSQEYNRRFAHVGTMWESSYHDKVIPNATNDMAKVLAYIHLNPIRAGKCAGFDEYPWSSLNAVAQGDPVACAGLSFVYGVDDETIPDEDRMTFDEAIESQHLLMDEVLEYEKRKHAEEVARRRAAGYEVPNDPLTDEAYVAQAAAHLKEVLDAGVALHEEARVYAKSEAKRVALEERILAAIRARPDITIDDLAKDLGTSRSGMYNCVSGLKKRGILAKSGKSWSIIQNVGQT